MSINIKTTGIHHVALRSSDMEPELEFRLLNQRLLYSTGVPFAA